MQPSDRSLVGTISQALCLLKPIPVYCFYLHKFLSLLPCRSGYQLENGGTSQHKNSTLGLASMTMFRLAWMHRLGTPSQHV